MREVLHDGSSPVRPPCRSHRKTISRATRARFQTHLRWLFREGAPAQANIEDSTESTSTWASCTIAGQPAVYLGACPAPKNSVTQLGSDHRFASQNPVSASSVALDTLHPRSLGSRPRACISPTIYASSGSTSGIVSATSLEQLAISLECAQSFATSSICSWWPIGWDDTDVRQGLRPRSEMQSAILTGRSSAVPYSRPARRRICSVAPRSASTNPDI